ncbi:hypothetical protein PVAP13_8KG067068 [Panicum virgatum]|uniref:Uncharacterized protein n=1 Tax=Panicum virgatum TaxID=38727 RepID=A0A8T0PIR2_PANVG|nr:hypothetical protein PVAP13_8KG067068 [Panicum virgatum]
MPATLPNAGRPAQSDQVSKRSKLKSVKSLRIDTGRSSDRSNALSYSVQKGEQNEILVCSQSCGTECAACIALFGISEYERAEEMEEMIAEVKGHMNPPASITMEGNKNEPNAENYVPQDSVDAMQKRHGLFESALPFHFIDDAFVEKEIPQWNAATVSTESEPVPENLVTPETKHDGLVHLNLEGSLSNKENMVANKIAEDSENYQLDSTNCGRNEEISALDKENITLNVSDHENSMLKVGNQMNLSPRILAR